MIKQVPNNNLAKISGAGKPTGCLCENQPGDRNEAKMTVALVHPGNKP